MPVTVGVYWSSVFVGAAVQHGAGLRGVSLPQLPVKLAGPSRLDAGPLATLQAACPFGSEEGFGCSVLQALACVCVFQRDRQTEPGNLGVSACPKSFF